MVLSAMLFLLGCAVRELEGFYKKCRLIFDSFHKNIKDQLNNYK